MAWRAAPKGRGFGGVANAAALGLPAAWPRGVVPRGPSPLWSRAFRPVAESADWPERGAGSRGQGVLVGWALLQDTFFWQKCPLHGYFWVVLGWVVLFPGCWSPGGEVPCVLVSARMRSRLAPLPASASALVGGFAMMMGLFLALGDVTWNYEVKP